MIRNFLKNGSRLLIRKQTNILSAASVLIITVFLSGILGVLKDRLLAGTFFAGNQQWLLDIYFAAFKIPDILFQLLVAGTLSAAFIPLLSHALDQDEKKAEELASSILNMVVLTFLFLAFVVLLFLRPLSRLLAPTLEPTAFGLLLNLSRLILLAQFFLVASSFLTGILQAHQRFLLPALAPLVYNLGIILGILFLSATFSIYGPVIGVIIGSLLHLLIQLPFVLKMGNYLRFSFKPGHPAILKILKLGFPRTLNLILIQIEQWIAIIIATSLQPGSLAIFNFAQHLNNMPVSLFGASLGQAALPTLVKEVKDKEAFKKTLVASFNQIAYLTLPISVLLLILRVPLVRLAFGAKGFPWQATLLTAKVVAIFSLSVFAQSLNQLLIRIFYALGNTKTPFFIGSVTTTIMVTTSLFFTYLINWGLLGLVAAISLSNFIGNLLLFIALNQRLKGLITRRIFLPISKIVFASFLMAVSLWSLMRLLDQFVFDTTRTANLILLTLFTVGTSLTLYFFTCHLLKVKEQKSLFAVFKRLARWRQLLEYSEEVIELPPTS